MPYIYISNRDFIIMLLLQVFYLIVFFLLSKSRNNRITYFYQSIVLLIKNIRKNYTSDEKIDPLLFFVVFFIVSQNILYVLGLFSIFTVIPITLFFMFFVFSVLCYIVICQRGFFGFLSSFIPPNIPRIMLPIMILIESISFLLKPIIASGRILISLYIGHILIGLAPFLSHYAIPQIFILAIIKNHRGTLSTYAKLLASQFHLLYLFQSY